MYYCCGLCTNANKVHCATNVTYSQSLYEVYDGDVPKYRIGSWRKVWETDEAASLFYPLEIEFAYHEVLDDHDTIWRRVLSKSYISVLPADKVEQLRADVYAVLEDPESDIEVDPATGLVRYPYETEVAWAKRRD